MKINKDELSIWRKKSSQNIKNANNICHRHKLEGGEEADSDSTELVVDDDDDEQINASEQYNIFHNFIHNIMGGANGKANRELTKDQIQFLQRATKLSESEIRQWHGDFLKDCPNGKLDKKRFMKMYKQIYASSKVEKICGFVFRAFDGDKNGTIDFSEFLISVCANSQGDSREKLEFAFKIHDVNKDGYITPKEMESVLKAMNTLSDGKLKSSPKEKVKNVFRIMDTNHDKKLSIDEFINGIMGDEELKNLLLPME
ncbi:hypothetical protein SNEBB_009812 [Seison nebaliae]|nr:hypothetical protein SNEBB_009812 [Seison nebaliae]